MNKKSLLILLDINNKTEPPNNPRNPFLVNLMTLENMIIFGSRKILKI